MVWKPSTTSLELSLSPTSATDKVPRILVLSLHYSSAGELRMFNLLNWLNRTAGAAEEAKRLLAIWLNVVVVDAASPPLFTLSDSKPRFVDCSSTRVLRASSVLNIWDPLEHRRREMQRSRGDRSWVSVGGQRQNVKLR